MIQNLIQTDSVEVARIDGALSYRAWDEVECDFTAWLTVHSSVLDAIRSMATASNEDVMRALSDDSTHNLSDEAALAIVEAVRSTDEPDAYAEMKVGSPVILDTTYEAELGQMRVTFWRGTQCRIVAGHSDNAGLEPAHKLWLVQFEQGEANYQLWFRANKLGLEA